MTKTQVYISDTDSEYIVKLAKQSGRKKSEIVRDAVHEYCRSHNGTGYQSALKSAFGIVRENPIDAQTLRETTREGFDSE